MRSPVVFLLAPLLALGTIPSTPTQAQPQSPIPQMVQAAQPEAELAALFPRSLEGRPLEVETLRGPEWVARFDPGDPDDATVIDRTQALVASAGADLDDLTIGIAVDRPSPEGDPSTIVAVRVDGADAHTLVEPAIWLLAGISFEPRLRWQSIADRWTIRVREASLPGTYPTTVYPAGDTVWVVQADRPSLDEVLTALPLATTGGRVDLPEAGISVTFPEDWTVKLADEHATVAAARGWIDHPPVERWRVLDAQAVNGPSDRCLLERYAARELSPDWLVARLRGGGYHWFIDSVDVGPVGLSAGEAIHVQVDGSDLPSTFSPMEHHMDAYLFDSGDGTIVLSCFSEDPPDDRWLSIAETVELRPPKQRGISLPARVRSDLTRIEVPEAGLAISLPDDWSVETVSENPDLGFLRIGPERFGPDVAIQNVLLSLAPGGRARDAAAGCTLVVYRPIALTADEFMDALWGGHLAIESINPRLSRVRAWPGLGLMGPYFMEQYAFGGDDAMAFLWCRDVDLPGDLWLAIAATLEFLPADG